MSALSTHYIKLLKSASDDLTGSKFPWLGDLRQRAKDNLLTSGLPSLRDEEWRYTNISAIEKNEFRVAPSNATIDQSLLDEALLDNCYHLVFVDGYYRSELSSSQGLPEGVTILPLSTVEKGEQEKQFKSLINASFDGEDEHGFTHLNTALFTDGVLLSIPDNTVVEKPIQLVYLASSKSPLAVSNYRNLILAKAGAKATVIESYYGCQGMCYLTNAVTEVVVETNANLSHTRLQVESSEAFHMGGVYSTLEKSAMFSQSNFTFGGLLSRAEIHADLGVESSCLLDGLFIGQDKQHLDHHTRLNHKQPHAVSQQLYKGIMADRSTGVFQGRILVAEDAQKTDATMNNRNLLLSERANIDSKPQLVIHADDVKCAHGVTIGQLDEAAIFYLRSRGADKKMAKNMLTFAFANEMVERISLKPLRHKVMDELLKQFPQTDILKEWL